jgi:hypothetical protein
MGIMSARVRRVPTDADLTLIAELAACDVQVSPYQLERWRQAGILPTPVRRALGRGLDSTSRYPTEALPMAIVLACSTGQGRSFQAAVNNPVHAAVSDARPDGTERHPLR